MTPDRPIALCAEACRILTDSGATIYQQWTCRACGHRHTNPEPDAFYAWGQCGCKTFTALGVCGYMVVLGESRGTH